MSSPTLTPPASPPDGVLRTRLLPPRLPPHCVSRGELVARTLDGLAGRMVSVVAGAGYGKSTLLAQCLHDSDMPWIWLSCDPRLTTPEMLAGHLAAGLSERFPGVASGLTPGADYATALANEIVATVPDDFVVAVDDVHALEEDAFEGLGRLIADLPPNVHLAIASRRRLPAGFGRVPAGGMTRISESELALSYDEAVQLLADREDPLDEVRIGEMHERTEGWVSGLLLATRQSRGELGDAAEASHFDYLAQEVFEALPADRRRFLTDTAVLERFTPELAGAVTGRADARELIESLQARHLFIVHLEDRWFRYHHLFQAFLRRRIEEHEPERLPEVHERAGEAWLEAGDNEEAVRHFLAMGHLERAADALEPVAEAMVATSEAGLLRDWLSELGEEVIADHPRLLMAHALLAYLQRDRDEAFRLWPLAIEALIDAGRQDAASAALYRFQQAMLTYGVNPAVRIDLGERYLERLAPSTQGLGMVHLVLGVAHAQSCRPDEAERHIAAALEVGGDREGPLLRPTAGLLRAFYMDFPAGKVDRALDLIDESLARLEPIEVQDANMLRAFGMGFRVVIYADIGRFRRSLREASAVMELSESLGMGAAAETLSLWWRLLAHAGLGDWESAVPVAETATPFSTSGGTTSTAYRISASCARVAAARGDEQRALSHITIARDELGAYGDSYDAPMSLCEMSLAAEQTGRAHLARELIEEACAFAERFGLDWYLARAALVSADLHGPGGTGDRRLADALRLTAEHGLDFLWSRRERPRAASLLARALDCGVGDPATVARIAALCGREVLDECLALLGDADPAARKAIAEAIDDRTDLDPSTLAALADDADTEVAEAGERARSVLETRPRPAIRVESFGGLSLFRAGGRVQDNEFGRPKARVLLGALLCAGRAGAHRDRLLNELWPDLEPARGSRALDTTLHALRRTLDPLTSARTRESLVSRDGDVYRLALGERDSWDAADFLALADPESDDGSLERLLRAEALWTADFLPDFPYEDWAQRARTDLERARGRLLERLGDALLANGRPVAAIARYGELLAEEPEREALHRALMRAYSAAGERALALRQFHACRATLRGALGVEPSAETRELYTSLL